MAHLDDPRSRTLKAALATAPIALLIVVAALFPGKTAELTPFALVLPLLSMAGLETALEPKPSASKARRIENRPALRCASAAA